jgi:integrase
MGVSKRRSGGVYWVQFRIGGKHIFRSARTRDRDKAEEFEQALRNRYWRQIQLGEQVHTWREAVERLKREAHWSVNTRAANNRAFVQFAMIDHVPLNDIGIPTIAEARSMLAETLGPSSVNRNMAVFRQVLRAAVAWGWLKHSPPVAMMKVIDREPTWLSPEGCEALVRELPSHLRAPAILSCITGMRMANTRDLTWGRVDLERGFILIPGSTTKTKSVLTVPLEAPAIALLRAIPREEGTDRVFTYRPFLKRPKGYKAVAGIPGLRGSARPITGTFNTRAFRKAVKRAGVMVRWHDLRHTFASWLAAAGASDRIITALLGWSSPAMVKRYSHLRLADTRSWASLASTNATAALAVVAAAGGSEQLDNQALGTCRLTESNCGPHHYEGSRPSNAASRINDLADPVPVEPGRNESIRPTPVANAIARFPGPRRKA